MVSSIPPTLLPQPIPFPVLIPRTHQSRTTLVPRHGLAKFSQRRDLKEEADRLSEEEAEIAEGLTEVRNHGHSFLIPLGKQMTLDEERADVGEPSEAGSASTSSQSQSQSASASASQPEADVTDLDADMQDLDADIPDEDTEASVVTDQSVADDEIVDEEL